MIRFDSRIHNNLAQVVESHLVL
uniref:Uncharacterized protein n=1 Tax=Rhizophora mucronata TaxID=61149 RepID=A0A2P2QIB7_RHIMU